MPDDARSGEVAFGVPRSPSSTERFREQLASDPVTKRARGHADGVLELVDGVDGAGRLNLGLTDASIVVLAERHAMRDLLTLHERHFRAVRTSKGKRSRLLPSDV